MNLVSGQQLMHRNSVVLGQDTDSELGNDDLRPRTIY